MRMVESALNVDLPNPAVANTLAVSEKLPELFEKVKYEPRQNFWVSVPITLTLRSELPMNAHLAYYSSYKDHFYFALTLIQTPEVFTHSNTFARAGWSAGVRSNNESMTIEISTLIGSFGKWEGNGFATALMSQTNAVINHQIGFQQKLWRDYPIVGKIMDTAGNTYFPKPRFGWSSVMAECLAYDKIKDGVYKKHYR